MMDSKTGSYAPLSKKPKPEKPKQNLYTYHILNETIPTHMAINNLPYSPIVCGKQANNSTKKQGENLDAVVYIYRLIRDQNSQLNRFARVQEVQGWEYGIPLVLLHPEQFRDVCAMCFEICKEMNVLVVKFDEAESIFNLDVTKAYKAWEEQNNRED